jgi:hypothetical protein
VVGIWLAPRATYADIAERPRVLGALLLSVVVLAGASVGFLTTEVGRQAALDQVTQQSDARGQSLTDAQYQQLERFAPYFGYFFAAVQILAVVVGSVLITLLALAVFNAFLGHTASFKQVFAVVVHSGFVLMLAAFLVFPLDYVRESLTSPTTLAVFLPFLEEDSFLARFFGAIDLIYLWWVVNLAIGLGVLYKRRTGPIAIALLSIYVMIALLIAGIRYALAGA